MNIKRPDFLKQFGDTEVELMLQNVGYSNSIKNGILQDENGDIIPWYCYSMVNFLKEKLQDSNIKIFEYGAGFSTLFYAKRSNTVISSETSTECKTWTEDSLKSLNLTAKITIEDQDSFAESIEKHAIKFDLIIVDSIVRNECVNYATRNISDNGVILLDNSERSGYKKSFELMKSIGYKNLTFKGLKPFSQKFASSTIFYRSGNSIFDI
jgi:hypothetical protein